jgi:hypothetical protein
VYSDHKHCISLRAHLLRGSTPITSSASASAASASASAASAGSLSDGNQQEDELVELDMSFESETLCSEWLNVRELSTAH